MITNSLSSLLIYDARMPADECIRAIRAMIAMIAMKAMPAIIAMGLNASP